MLRIYLKEGNKISVIITEPSCKAYTTSKYILTEAGKFLRADIVKIEVFDSGKQEGLQG